MGNRQGTLTKTQQSNGANTKKHVADTKHNENKVAVLEPEVKKRRSCDDKKSSAPQKPSRAAVAPEVFCADDGGEITIQTNAQVPRKRKKPAELIDEDHRHRDHQLPELMTITNLSADDDDTENEKKYGGVKGGKGIVDDVVGDGKAVVDKTANNDVKERKMLQLTIYRSYSNSAAVTTASGGPGVVARRSSSTRGGGVIVEKPEPRLDDVKIYRRSRVGTEVVGAEPTELKQPHAARCTAEVKTPEGTGTPTSSSGAESGSKNLNKNKRNKRSRSALGNKRKQHQPSAELVRSVTAPPRWNFSATIRDYPELIGRRSVKMRWDSVSDTRSRSSTVNSSPAAAAAHGSEGDSVGWCRVSKTDFPETAAIVRRLRRFEEHFVASFIERFASLPVRVQLASVAVALRHAPEVILGSTIVVSLQQYLRMTSSSLAAEIESRRDYVIIVPEELFRKAQMERCRVAEGDDVTTGNGPLLAREAATSAASLAADEISRMFEYQIALIGTSDGPIKMLAEHACDCVIEYVIGRQNRPTNRLLDRNTVVEGVLLGRPTNQTRTFISVVVGERELKWNLREVFSRPGLRRETLLFADEDSSSPAVNTPSGSVPSQPSTRVIGRNGVRRPPWTCHTVSSATASASGGSRRCDPLLYGYRGLAVLWDFTRGGYIVDESTGGLNYFDEMVVSRYDDFHRLYCSYRRLVGADVMRKHLAAVRACPEGSQTSTFADLVLNLHGAAYARDEIQPIYRPLVTDMVELHPVRRRSSNAQPAAVRRHSSSVVQQQHLAAPSRSSNTKVDREETTKQQQPTIIIEAEQPASKATTKSGSFSDAGSQRKRSSEGGLHGAPPSESITVHPPSGASTATPSPSMTSSRLLLIVAESGGNVRRLVADIRSHAGGAKKAATKTTAEESAADSAGKSPDVQSPDDVISGGVNAANDDDNEVFEIETICASAPVLNSEPHTSLKAALSTAHQEPSCQPDVPADSHNIVAASSSNTCNPDVKLRIPASKRVQFIEAIKTLRAAELVSNLPETSPPMCGRDKQVNDLCQLLTTTSGCTPPRLVLVTGCLGIGKSAVSRAACHRLLTYGSHHDAAPPQILQHEAAQCDVSEGRPTSGQRSAERVFEAVVLVECRGCDGTRESLLARIFATFGVPYRARHDDGQIDWFCRWLSHRTATCSPRRLLVVLDNLDTPEERYNVTSLVVDQLLTGVEALTLLVTARRSFYEDSNRNHHHQQFGVIDLENRSADEIFQKMVSDLSDEDACRLAAVCRNLPGAIRPAAGALLQLRLNGNGSTTRAVAAMLDAMTAACCHPAMASIEADVEALEVIDGGESRQVEAIATTILAVLSLHNTPEIAKEILFQASNNVASFSTRQLIDRLPVEHRRLAPSVVDDLIHLGLIDVCDDVTSTSGIRCLLSPAVRLVARRLTPDPVTADRIYCIDQLHRLAHLARQFHSGEADAVFQLLDATHSDRDNFVDAVRRSTRLLVSGTGTFSPNCSDEGYDPWTTLVSVEGAAFLDEFLPDDAYFGLFDTLAQGVSTPHQESTGEVGSASLDVEEEQDASNFGSQSRLRCRALCCCACRDALRGRPNRAADYVSRAQRLLPVTSDVDDVNGEELASTLNDECLPERAFCAYSLALVYRDRSATIPRLDHGLSAVSGPLAAVELARRAVEEYRMSVHRRLSSIGGPLYALGGPLYAIELLASTLADVGQTQSALNSCRTSDDMLFASSLVLGPAHPLTLSGSSLRSKLWSSVGLLDRARRAAVTAGEAASRYHGVEHPATASVMETVCDVVERCGLVDEAICVAIQTLGLRVKTLGEHLNTATSFRTLSRLLLKRRVTDAAVVFADIAVQVLRRIAAPTAEAEQESARAHARHDESRQNNGLPSAKSGNTKGVLQVSDVVAHSGGDSCRRSVTFNSQPLAADHAPTQLIV